MPRADRRRLPWRPALIDGDRPAPHVALDADLVTQLGWDLVLAIAANGGKGSVGDSGPGRHPSTLERWPQPARRRRPLGSELLSGLAESGHGGLRQVASLGHGSLVTLFDRHRGEQAIAGGRLHDLRITSMRSG